MTQIYIKTCSKRSGICQLIRLEIGIVRPAAGSIHSNPHPSSAIGSGSRAVEPRTTHNHRLGARQHNMRQAIPDTNHAPNNWVWTVAGHAINPQLNTMITTQLNTRTTWQRPHPSPHHPTTTAHYPSQPTGSIHLLWQPPWKLHFPIKTPHCDWVFFSTALLNGFNQWEWHHQIRHSVEQCCWTGLVCE